MLKLRNEVLKTPLGLSIFDEDLEDEKKDLLLCSIANNEVVACCVLHSINDDSYQLKQMAVYKKSQRQGIGKQMLTFAERILNQRDIKEIILEARKVSVMFYSKNGYNIIGNEFMKIGIPHFRMHKLLIKQ